MTIIWLLQLFLAQVAFFSTKWCCVWASSPSPLWTSSSHSESSRSLSSTYALYSLPPFSMSFTTTATAMALEAEDGSPILASALSAPLRMLTSEFLLESFRIQIAKADIRETEISDLIRSLQTLDLQVAVHRGGGGGTPEDEEGRRRQLVDLQPYWAEFHTTAAFIEPMDATTKPSNKEVSELMGGWIDLAFMQDKDYYLDLLHKSEHAALVHIKDLDVDTNWDPNTDGYPVANNPMANNPISPNASTQHLGVWSKTEQILLCVLLILITVLTLVSLTLALRRWSGIEKLDFRTSAFTDDTASHSEHDDEVLNALEASDRWLSQNRPDLLNIIQKGSSPERPSGKEEQLSCDIEGNPPTKERRYTTPSNPFQYLYSASSLFGLPQPADQTQVVTQPKIPQDDSFSAFQRFTRNQGRQSGDIDTSNAGSLNSSLSGSGEEAEPVTGGDLPGYVPFKVWLQHQFSFLSYREPNPPPLYEDGLVFVDEDLACDEDPTAYSFPFQDFPRQDGTPCLIFHDHEQAMAKLAAEDWPRHEDVLRSDNDRLTNAEFQRALSQHNLLSGNEMDSSLVEDFVGGEVLDEYIEPEPHKDDAEFLEKLERLIAMRHRHYEKEAIVEKHRQARKREREEKKKKDKQEVEKRELLLRRHCLELDMQELEAKFVPQVSTRNLLLSNKNQSDTPQAEKTIPRSSSEPDFLADEAKESTVPQAVKMPPRVPTKISPTSVLDEMDLPRVSPSSIGPRKTPSHHRRSFSFGNIEEKKDGSVCSASHRRSGSGVEDVMVHGIYAQFV